MMAQLEGVLRNTPVVAMLAENDVEAARMFWRDTVGLEEVYHDGYFYWNVTFTATLAPFELQLAYLGVDDTAAEHFRSDAVGDRVAFTALWRFSSTN